MKTSTLITLCKSAALLAIGLAARPATGGEITWQDLPNSHTETSFTVDGVGVNVTSAGGAFQQKTVAGLTATGVSGGSVHGEIDGNQAITFTFAQAVAVSSLSVAFLYTEGNFGDVENELARFVTDAGDFTLEAAGPSAGIWTGFGDVSNVSPGVEGHSGAWSLAGENIFGSPITTLTLTPGNPGSHSRYGDFSFHSMAMTAIPAPGAMAVILGAMLVAPCRRRA